MQTNYLKVLTIFFLLFLCQFSLLLAQSNSLYFKHLTRDNNLSSNHVNCICEDEYGFIWFGTEDGLNKYDGYNFEIFRHGINDTTGISDNRVQCIIGDNKNGNLWIGTTNGLNYFNKSTYKFTKYFKNSFNNCGLSDNSIMSLCFDKDSSLWVGTEKGLNILDKTGKQFIPFKILNTKYNAFENSIWTIYCDYKNRIWIGTMKGLFIFNKKDSSIINYNQNNNIHSIRNIYEDKNNNIWICTDKQGIFLIEQGNLNNKSINYNKENGSLINNRAHNVVEDSFGYYYIINRDGGLTYFNQKQNKIHKYIPDKYNPNSLNSKALISIYKDSKGIIWIGTFSSGINYIDNQRKPFEHYTINFKETGLFNNNIRSLFEDSQGNIWVGTKEGGGLSKFDRDRGTFKHYKNDPNNKFSLSDDYIFSINEIDSNLLLVGTYRKGLDIFDKTKDKFYHYSHNKNDLQSISSNRVSAIFKDQQGTIWIGNDEETDIFDPDNRVFTKTNIKLVFCFCNEGANNIWMGTKTNGLYLYNKTTGKSIIFNYSQDSKSGINNNNIRSIKKDSKNNLWIGTEGGGVNVMDIKNKKFRAFTEKDGLSNNRVCGLLIDELDNIWISTTNGLSKFIPPPAKHLFDENHKGEFRNYNINDGLQGNEFESLVCLQTKNGEMLFGGRNGFNIFHPSKIVDNPNKPNIVINDLKLFNKSVKIGDENSPIVNHISQTKELTLSNYQTVITLEFIALNYTSPEKVQYSYMLEGFDKDWVKSGTKRTATYTNLDQGNYIFRVIASNNDGIWNTKGATLKINILPPFWKTKWAYVIYGILILLILALIRKYSIIGAEEKTKLLVERYEHEKAEEVNSIKLKFFTNISHEFRTPLTLILGPLENLLSSDINDTVKKQLLLMRRNAELMLRLINQLLDVRKSETGNLKLKTTNDDIVNFIKETAILFNSLAEQNTIKFAVKTDFDNYNIWFDHEKLEKVLFNLLSNAFKFTPVNGKISISISKFVSENAKKPFFSKKQLDEYIEIKVTDTGIGISKKMIGHIFERFFQIKSSGSEYQGTGIGLSLTRDLVRLHGGKITAESQENQGSCFTVRLPTGDKHLKSNQKTDKKVEKYYSNNIPNTPNIEGNNSPTLSDSKLDTEINDSSDKPLILVIDDHKDIRDYIIQNLSSIYNFEEAANGKEGFDIAINTSPLLIISDVMMPVINGIELCKKLKAEIQTSHIPVILLTARTSLDYKIEGIETGADAYISKPFSLKLLEAQINNLINSRNKLQKLFKLDVSLQPKDITLTSIDANFIEKAMQITEKYMSDTEFDVAVFVKEMGMSRSVLYKKFKALNGQSINEFINSIRMKRAIQLLVQDKISISDVAYEVGFSNPKYFSTCFKKQFEMTPSKYISKHKQ